MGFVEHQVGGRHLQLAASEALAAIHRGKDGFVDGVGEHVVTVGTRVLVKLVNHGYLAVVQLKPAALILKLKKA